MTIAVDDVTFEAHRLVLSACSPYFKHLLTTTKCKHPVIFLKDVEASHVALLLRYMYLGQIAVKKEELGTVLKAADYLKIRGLAMTSPTGSGQEAMATNVNAVVMGSNDPEDDEAQRKIIAQPHINGSRKSGGSRKGYLPKKIRTSGDRISDASSSPGHFSDSGLGAGSPLPGPQRRNSGPLPTIMETFNNNSKDVEHMETLEHEGAATTTEEEDAEDQPVDFSQTGNPGNQGQTNKYSILSNYLKTGRLGHKQIMQDPEGKMDENEAASISKAAEVNKKKI